MTSRTVLGLLGATILAVPGTALAKSQTFVDLQAGVGYSTNPLLQPGDTVGSGYGRISAYGYHGWTSERAASSVSAYVENSSYFRRYDNKQVFSLSGDTSYAANEKVRLTGGVSFSGDIGGQLSSRFYGVPATTDTPLPLTPVTVIITDPNVVGLNRRQYTLAGHVGGDFTLSPRDSLTTSLGVQHLFVSGSGLDYTSYSGTIGYNRQLNERVSVGAQLITQYSDYQFGRSIFEIGPQATVRAQLSSHWDVTGAIGVVRTTQDVGIPGVGKDSSLNLALDASLCRRLEYENICFRAARRTQSSIYGGAPTSTTARADYFRRLGAKDTVQLGAEFTRSGDSRVAGFGQRSTYYAVTGAYDRSINDRLSAGVNAAFRKLDSNIGSFRSDVGGSAYIRYRLGDIR